MSVSIHARLVRGERLVGVIVAARCRDVSIHARLVRGERLGRIDADHGAYGAVSIHARLVRGERPRSDYRVAEYVSGVSIHARLVRGERPSATRNDSSGNGFNPRPPRERRATHSPVALAGSDVGFNPRPPRERRATRAHRLASLHDAVSIHARLVRGERPLLRNLRLALPVSIHARLVRGERPCATAPLD